MHFILDCDGVLNSISKVRGRFIPKPAKGEIEDWSDWHNNFTLETPNVEGMKLLNRMIPKGSRISLVSLRHQGLERDTYDYIREFKLLPKLSVDDIHFCPPKLHGDLSEFKRSVIKGIVQGGKPWHPTSMKNSTIFIDDSMDNINATSDIVTALYYPTFRG